MRAIGMTLALILMATAVRAQQAPPAEPPTKLFSSASDVTGLIAKAKSERKDGQANVMESILQLAPYGAHLEYRASIGPAAIHEKDAEFMYVLVDEKRTNPANLSGTGIEGGNSQHVSKGDFMVVPENTAHWFSAIDGTLVLMTLHVPRPVPAAK